MRGERPIKRGKTTIDPDIRPLRYGPLTGSVHEVLPGALPRVTWTIENPDREAAHNRLRITREQAGETRVHAYAWDEAESTWRALTRDHPDFGRAWLNLASLSIQRENWAEAERMARAAVEADSTSTRSGLHTPSPSGSALSSNHWHWSMSSQVPS